MILRRFPWASGMPVTFNLPVTTIWELRMHVLAIWTLPLLGIWHVVEALMLGPHPYGVHIDANTVVTRLYADGTLGIMVETLNVFSVKLT